MNELPSAGCIADIDNIVLNMTEAPKIGDAFCTLGDKTLYVIGKFIGSGTSYFGKSTALRWNIDKEDKARGFWNRGLACYMCKQPAWLDSLKRCK